MSPRPLPTPSTDPHRDDDRQPVADLNGASLPTRATLRRRRSITYQFGRFIAFNVRILRMAAKGHH